MKLVLHQLRLEFRRAKIALALYLVILLCNFALAAGWVGAPATPTGQDWIVGGVLPVLFILGYWIAFAMIVATCVLADSPARHDRFLRTRPLPGRSLAGAKALYILLAAVVPAALVEALSLATVGGPAGVVVYAALERALFCAALALAVAAFAAHWKNTQGLVLAGLLAFAGVMILGRVTIVLVRSLGALKDPLDGEPTYLTAVQAFLVLAAGLGLTAWICSRRGRKFRYLIPAFLPVLLAALYVLTSSPWRTAPYRPIDQGSIDELLASGAAGAKVVPHGIQIGKQQDSRKLRASFSFTPVTSGFPRDLELRWSPVNHRWLVDGKVARRDMTDPNRLGAHYVSSDYVSSDSVPISWSLTRAIQSHLGSAVHFRTDHGSSHHISRLSVHSLEYLPDGPYAGKEASVETGLVGDAFSWKVAADLEVPATEDKPEKNPKSRWQIASIVRIGNDLRLLLSERAIALHTSGNLSRRAGRGHWSRDYRFVLYLPHEDLALFGNPRSEQPALSVSAAKRYYGSIDFEDGRRVPLPPALLRDARLLILENEYIGRLETEFKSARFTLQKRRTHRGSAPSPYEDHEKLSSAEFALWFHRGEKLSPDEPADRVHPHLERLLEQAGRLERRIYQSREPAVIYAATFVPRHLDFMLEILPDLPFPSEQFLIAAIARGAEESQQREIVAASVTNSSLSSLAIRLGWYKNSRETLTTIARASLNSDPRFTQELLALNDPDLDSLVLDRYRANPTTELYELLRGIPRLTEETERITDELWEPGRLVIARGRPQGLLPFALLQGKREALDELFAALRMSAMDDQVSQYELSQLITRTIRVPRKDRDPHDEPERIVKWALQYKSTDFAFDPLFRRFALKSGANTL